eukprot:945229-Rhodomonas_salina.1
MSNADNAMPGGATGFSLGRLVLSPFPFKVLYLFPFEVMSQFPFKVFKLYKFPFKVLSPLAFSFNLKPAGHDLNQPFLPQESLLCLKFCACRVT